MSEDTKTDDKSLESLHAGLGGVVIKCARCDGCGKIANTDEGEPWSAWLDLPLRSCAAVAAGIVKPIPCPECNGAGTFLHHGE